MDLFKKAWNNFKTQPEIWFFYAFLATSMLSVRKVVADVFVAGEFNEYTGTYLYLSDIFLVLTVAVWGFIILYNKLTNSSISSSAVRLSPHKFILFHVEQYKFLPRGTFAIILIPLVLVIWSFLSLKWSSNASIALYRSFKLFEFYLLFLFLALSSQCSTSAKKFAGEHFEKPESNFLRNAFRIIIAIGLINAVIGILQFILQHSLGLFWLKESLISPDLPGVAKVVLGVAKYIRAYGLFPHPNILGGFLFLSIILTLAYWKLFHVKQSKPVCATLCASWDNGQCKIYSAQNSFSADHNCFTWNNYRRYNRNIFAFILGIQIVAGILTFSKSAILAFILALAYIFWPDKNKLFHVEQFNTSRGKTLKMVFLTLVIVGLGIYLIQPDLSSIFIKSIVERLVYINIALNMINGNFLAGIGSSQFISEMHRYSTQALLPWQFQPVHNVLLLIWSEMGLVGISLLIWFIWKLFHYDKNVPRGTNSRSGMEHESLVLGVKNVPRGTTGFLVDTSTVFKALLIGFLAITLFDHYLWDIQQGQIMLWMVFGLLAGTKSAEPIT